MSASIPEPSPAASIATRCPLCGATVGSNDERCRACNMTLAGLGGRPNPFTRRSLWWWAAALLAIYLAVVLVVVAVR